MHSADYPEATLDRFWAKVRKTDDCWLWTAGKNGPGYGQFWVSSERRKIGAHRASYEIHKGPIPLGLEIDHLCRVPACVNPDHLEAVTHRENDLRGIGVSAINAAKTHCLNGHPLSGENLYVLKGKRWCRECQRRRGRRMDAIRKVRGRAPYGKAKAALALALEEGERVSAEQAIRSAREERRERKTI